MKTNLQIIKVSRLWELIQLLTDRSFGNSYGEYQQGLAGRLTASHEHSNGLCSEEVISDQALMAWLCRPKGLLVLMQGTHTGNCVGDVTATVAVTKVSGIYLLTKKWEDEQETRLLAVISANKNY